MISTEAAAIPGVSRDRLTQLAVLLRLARPGPEGTLVFDERAVRALAGTGLVKHARPCAAPSVTSTARPKFF